MIRNDRIGAHGTHITIGTSSLIKVHHQAYRHSHVNTDIYILLCKWQFFPMLLNNIYLIQIILPDQLLQFFQTSQIFFLIRLILISLHCNITNHFDRYGCFIQKITEFIEFSFFSHICRSGCPAFFQHSDQRFAKNHFYTDQQISHDQINNKEFSCLLSRSDKLQQDPRHQHGNNEGFRNLSVHSVQIIKHCYIV